MPHCAGQRTPIVWLLQTVPSGRRSADLEGEGEADGVEAQELYAVRHGSKVLGQRSGSLPQAVHQRVGRLEAKPIYSLEGDGPAVCPKQLPI